jgi:hypothetical protein
MKRLVTIFALASILLVGESFKVKHRRVTDQYKTEGYLQAVIDGKIFETRDDNRYTATLKNKSTDNFTANNKADAPLSRVENMVSFFGGDFQDPDGNIFNESVGFEYTFNDGSLGDAANQRITLNYNNQKYYNVEGETRLKITRIQWSSDRRNFTMDAEFDCKMRRWGVPFQAQPTVHLKGKMEGINVTVPSWIITKNPNQTAER